MAGAAAQLTAATQRDKSLAWRTAPHLMEGLSLPATPSKSKLPGRRGFCSVTTLLVIFAMVAGVAIFNQELGAGGGASRTETYYRKALVAKMYFGSNGQTVTATSEEYSRSTVKEAAAGRGKVAVAAVADAARGARGAAAAAHDDDLDLAAATKQPSNAADASADLDSKPSDAGQHQVAAADNSQQPQQVVTTVTAVTTTISSAATTSDASSTAAQHQQKAAEAAAAAATAATAAAAQQQQQQQQPAATEQPAVAAATEQPAAAATEQPAAAATEQPAAAATEQPAAAATAQTAAAAQEPKQEQQPVAAASEQPKQEQQKQPDAQPAQQPVDPADVEAWWSDVIAPTGERVPKAAKRDRDISASLATAVTFDESAVGDLAECKIAVLDVDKEWGDKWGAGNCNLNDPRTWPFNAPGKGIDGHDALPPEHYQYSMEYWIAQSIRNSSRYTDDLNTADFIFVDMHCYHSAWMAWLHPLNEEGRKLSPSPEFYIKRAFTKMQGMRRFRETKGGSFGLVHPAPLMKGLFSEEAACEDLASVLNMVPERSLLCVWTQDSHTAGKSVLLPYAATSDVDVSAPVVPAADRETLVFFQGGCGNPDPTVRPQFAAGKMLRYWLVQELQALKQPDIHAECTCDICEGHMRHDQLIASMSRSVFCPILPSNTQSSRRLSEAMLTGCIPVFVGEPFHTLPLAGDVDYKSFALFVNVSDNSPWVNTSSPKWEHNHMIAKAWKLDDRSLSESIMRVDKLEGLVRLLRSMPADEVAARQAAVIANRLKFYYPAATPEALAAAATAGGAGALGGAPGAATATSGSLLGHGLRRRHRSLLMEGPEEQPAAAAAAAGAAQPAQQQQQQQQPQAAQPKQQRAPAPAPPASVLGELLMRKMCHRAAAVKKRLEEAAQQGLDLKDSDEKVEHPSLAAQAAAEGSAGGEEAAAAAAAATA